MIQVYLEQKPVHLVVRQDLSWVRTLVLRMIWMRKGCLFDPTADSGQNMDLSMAKESQEEKQMHISLPQDEHG